jgi:asparagine synthase (glutamine-hydrolysing)
VPTALVARLARQGVTVALSGDGGDELFFGYTRYVRALRNWQMLGRVPGPLRRWMGARAQQQGEASRTGGLAALLAESGARGIGDVYRNRISRWRDPAGGARRAGRRQLLRPGRSAARRRHAGRRDDAGRLRDLPAG